jgi:SPP1 family predicted phage head-tail adaptor
VRYGRLDRRIAIQRKTVTQSPSGQPVETWATLATRWASVKPVSGDERFSDPQLAAKQQTEFEVRHAADVASLTPMDRIVLTATGAVHDILAVHEIGRREGLKIIAVRRSDTA